MINTRQTVRADDPKQTKNVTVQRDSNGKLLPVKRLSFLETFRHILKTDGPLAFWRGLGPALVLVINPILQYTVFEQLKNWLVKSRLNNKKSAVLTDWDFFLLVS